MTKTLLSLKAASMLHFWLRFWSSFRGSIRFRILINSQAKSPLRSVFLIFAHKLLGFQEKNTLVFAWFFKASRFSLKFDFVSELKFKDNHIWGTNRLA